MPIVEIEVAPDPPADRAARTARTAEVQHHIKVLIGVACDVAIMEVDAVPRSERKAVRVRDLRK